MKTSLFMDFTVDKVNKKIKVQREFDASVPEVWEAYTDPELLDQWWAPKPYKTVTVGMDFREGGRWLYYMLGPEGNKHYCLAEYKTIQAQKNFSALDAFCDEKGNINMQLPRAQWLNVFKATGETTLVSIEITYDKLEDIETITEMGFKEGLTMAMENLDEIFRGRK